MLGGNTVRDLVHVLLAGSSFQDADLFTSMYHDPGAAALLEHAAEYAEQRVKNLANVSEIPDGLKAMTRRMAAGEFMRSYLLQGEQPLDDDTAAGIVKQLKEGDTEVTFAVDESLSPQSQLAALIDRLCAVDMSEIYRYRRVIW